MVNEFGQMEIDMQENSKMTKNMVKEILHSSVVAFILAIGLMMKWMATGDYGGQVVTNIVDISERVNSMAKGRSVSEMVALNLDFGKRVDSSKDLRKQSF